MSKLLRATAWKTGLVVLGGCCLAVVIVAGASARTTSTPPPVDHQLCYTAAGMFKVPRGVKLIDQFSPKGFVPTISSNAVLHCNPVIKTVTSAAGQHVYKVTNPAAHLACFTIASQTQQPTPIVVVKNQFGSGVLKPSQPNLLCVPSWKSLTGPPNKKPNTPPNLNHFTCYPVSLQQGGYKPPGAVTLRDEFTSKPVSVQVNPVPQELCLPTEKIVGSHTYKIINPTLHLLCFAVTKTPDKTPVWDENQFGTAKVAIRVTKWLCLPSTKKLG